MNIEEKYQKAIDTLRAIASFGHTENCSSSAPVHECCCYGKDEKQLAQGCLNELGE